MGINALQLELAGLEFEFKERETVGGRDLKGTGLVPSRGRCLFL